MKIKFSGTEHTLPDAGMSDTVAFERHFNLPSSVLSDQNNYRAEWMCFLAWRGLVRSGVSVGAFDDAFLDALDFSEDEPAADAADEALDPTAPAVPTT